MRKRVYKHISQIEKILSREEETVYKNWGGKLPIVLIYPNSYRVGMSSLAIHAIYGLFNDEPDVVCERAFYGFQHAPRFDEPIFSLESQRPLDDFAVLAFSISYELDYFNVVHMLRKAGIPIFAQDRDKSWPLIIAGGPAIYTNPEPMADIFDAIAIGDGEVIIPPLIDVLWESTNIPRQQAYANLANVDGMYVPSYRGEGTHTPPPTPPFQGEGRDTPPPAPPLQKEMGVPCSHLPLVGCLRRENAPINRIWLKNLNHAPATTHIYTKNTEFGDKTLIEIARGCGRGCRFCLAGYVYRPMREVDIDTVLALARQGLMHRDKIGLVSASVSDHSAIDKIAIELRKMGAKLSASSMRVDPISEPLIKGLAESGNQTLTIAPEAGSLRLRNIINKPQSDEQILHAVSLATKYNFPQLKMYFMVGQPLEQEQDIEAIADLVLHAKKLYPRNMVINATPYVPKAHTTFQWSAMTDPETIKHRIAYLTGRLNPHGVTVRSDSPAWARIEGVLARGDRRLGRVLARMQKTSIHAWQTALAHENLTEHEFLRERDMDERLPWQVVNTGITNLYFTWEFKRALRNELTGACPPSGCLKCGVCGE